MLSQKEIEVLVLEEGEIYWAGKNIRSPLPYSGLAMPLRKKESEQPIWTYATVSFHLGPGQKHLT